MSGLNALVVYPQAHGPTERPPLRGVVTQSMRGSEALEALCAEQRHLLLGIQDAEVNGGLGDARDGVELTVEYAPCGRAAYEVHARKEPETLPVSLVRLVYPDGALPNGRLGIQLRIQAPAVSIAHGKVPESISRSRLD